MKKLSLFASALVVFALMAVVAYADHGPSHGTNKTQFDVEATDSESGIEGEGQVVATRAKKFNETGDVWYSVSVTATGLDPAKEYCLVADGDVVAGPAFPDGDGNLKLDYGTFELPDSVEVVECETVDDVVVQGDTVLESTSSIDAPAASEFPGKNPIK